LEAALDGYADEFSEEFDWAVSGQATCRTLWHRYAAAFPNDPLPMMYWHRGYGPELDRLMERAIAAGRPLTPEALCEAQGIGMPPPGAVVSQAYPPRALALALGGRRTRLRIWGSGVRIPPSAPFQGAGTCGFRCWVQVGRWGGGRPLVGGRCKRTGRAEATDFRYYAIPRIQPAVYPGYTDIKTVRELPAGRAEVPAFDWQRRCHRRAIIFNSP
jgi:hypothetical protein